VDEGGLKQSKAKLYKKRVKAKASIPIKC